ncbi:MAG TPA: glycosyltransferase family 1 protein [Bryobacteraceae bacterium]|nr:glycosyltransferase family 1 protein [Bryobacteraceae bacterium]
MNFHINNILTASADDVLCLSHLRWGFVYQRPQHLLSRFARDRRVFFVEEPVTTEGAPRMELRKCPESGVNIVVPQIPANLSPETTATIQKLLLNNLIKDQHIDDYLLWYYTPMALQFSRHLTPKLTVFDVMDELSAFKGAPQDMKDREAELLRRADIVFTGGQSLYEAKKGRHDDLHPFPSSVDTAHFGSARTITVEPEDQAVIPHPRIGYCGVIDERMDLALIDSIAAARPDWHIVMVGPVVKVDPETLPHRANIHFLGGKTYKELPQYLAGWDVAMLPFAHNESTRFISPTKTPEYLAAGLPVVSTSITDVVRPYGVQKLVRIADTVDDFVTAIQGVMEEEVHDAAWRARVDAMLAHNSWDITWRRMRNLIHSKLARTQKPQQIGAMDQGAIPVRTVVLGD